MNPNHDPAAREPLRDALRRAADQLNTEQPARDVPAAVWAAMDRLSPQRAPTAAPSPSPSRSPAPAPAPRRAAWPVAWAGGLLAFASLAVAMLLLVGTAPIADERARQPMSASTAFLPLVAAERWPQLLREAREQGPAWVVATEMPHENLAAMGLPYDPARAGESVRAELLVHASGDVLAVRFVH